MSNFLEKSEALSMTHARRETTLYPSSSALRAKHFVLSNELTKDLEGFSLLVVPLSCPASVLLLLLFMLGFRVCQESPSRAY